MVTFDLGFADVRTYPPEDYRGLIMLRLRQQDKAHVVVVFRELLPMLETEQLTGHLWIVEEGRVRIRG